MASAATARCRVLMLHDVGSDSDSEFNISCDSFGRVVKFLKHNPTVSTNVIDHCASGSYALTFDDVCRNVYHNAFPLLTEHQVLFTLFVSLSLLDSPGYITSAELREMAASPFATVGSHGIRHTFYRNLTLRERAEELRASREQLEQLCGVPVESFAFPYGSEYQCGFFGKKMVLDHYKRGFGTIAMPVTRFSHRYFYPRINLTEKAVRQMTDDS
jgi:polysaccharide deacetylase